jgi:hypothetical protein
MKKVVHEIHRRSLWQMLGIYLAGSWIALQVVEQLTEAAGLPEWVRPFSLVLLLLGFPIVMATAFIQQGMTGKQAEPPGQSVADGQSRADEGDLEPPPAREQGTHHKLFTWKNAMLGGLAAFALLGILTAGYLFMRTTGIGPAGTLVAQGLLEEGAKVVLADFESADEDADRPPPVAHHPDSRAERAVRGADAHAAGREPADHERGGPRAGGPRGVRRRHRGRGRDGRL